VDIGADLVKYGEPKDVIEAVALARSAAAIAAHNPRPVGRRYPPRAGARKTYEAYVRRIEDIENIGLIQGSRGAMRYRPGAK
jgi:hypothetical protein